MDKEAIARELLAAEYERDGEGPFANEILHGNINRTGMGRSLRAIVAALDRPTAILALQSSERGEPAKTLEQIATDMDRAIAGGMAWISDDEEVEFARRIRKVASNLSPAEPSPESREGIIEECAKVAEEYPSLEYADIAVVRGIASAIRALSAPAHD